MHVTDENVIVEIVDDQGRPVSTGDCGEIVVTHLDAYAMPLIRYRTGDTGRLVGEPCACGRGLSRVEVVGGRRTDHLVAADGRRMHGLSLIYVLRELDNVARFQIRQQADGAVEVCVVPLGRFGELDRERIVTGIRQRVGEGLPITVKCVPHLAPSPSGKFRYVTSQMAVQEAWV